MSAKQIIKESAIDNELNELEKASKEKLLTIIKEAKENINKNNSEKRINKEYYNYNLWGALNKRYGRANTISENSKDKFVN